MSVGRSVRLLAMTAVAVVAVGAGLLASSSASLNAQTANNGNVWSFTSLYAPSSLTAVSAGDDVALGWTAGTNGNGYSVLGATNGSSSNCGSATYAAIGSSVGTTYTDAGRFTPQGTYYCYQVQTSYGSWTSVTSNPTAAAQLGFVASTGAAANGGQARKLDTGDTITIDFDQAVNTATGPGGTNTVCTFAGSTDTIVLGATATTGACAAGEANSLGTLTGGSLNKNERWNATWVWSNGNRTLTITIGARVTSPTESNATGTWTFTPTTTASKLLSSTGSFHVCDTNAGGGNCLPVLTGSF